eukprot:gnl/TRDRNA2_/TRDRNA2_143328_c0_seq2.p1 gnl/TRDRNA2_/TRDRNA2_143328_c0~~gnl/TRDRNA2_/TRDRNA2_143328_c0_seq2.p1  ORF type:complete len:434 (-),score=57.38 gnl/TRDRNA2_/TRDRNA2_143328_c0_seq2:60-1337(-)
MLLAALWAAIRQAYLEMMKIPYFESEIRDRADWKWHPTSLADMRIPHRHLSAAELESLDREGYLLVRDLLPKQMVKELYASAVAAYHVDITKREGGFLGSWWLLARQAWMEVDAFADFMFHRDSPLGHLAAQVFNTSTVRVAAESLKGTSPEAAGSSMHVDAFAFAMLRVDQPWPSLRDVPTMRALLILADEEVSAGGENSSGGALSFVPLDVWAASGCDKVEEPARGDCYERLKITPGLALGDVIIYHTALPHSTQRMIRGRRISYVVQLIGMNSPEHLLEWSKTEPVCNVVSSPMQAAPWQHWCGIAEPLLPDMLGISAGCFDTYNRARNYNLFWPSVNTFSVSWKQSACVPQVYPEPLENELEARRRAQVLNLMGSRYSLRSKFRKAFPHLLNCYFDSVYDLFRLVDLPWMPDAVRRFVFDG